MPVHTLKGAEVQLYPFSGAVLEGVGGQCYTLAALPLGNNPDTHITGFILMLITNYIK